MSGSRRNDSSARTSRPMHSGCSGNDRSSAVISLPDDDRPGAVPVVILGHSLWRNRYASDPSVLGRTIRVNGVPSVVIGVMPDGFSFPTRSRLWQPLALLPDRMLASRDARDLSAFGRLAARRQHRAGRRRLERDRRRARRSSIPRRIATLHRSWPRIASGPSAAEGRSTLPVLMGVVAVVLLMACANVANLLLARAAVRSHEISVRMAIGAGRGQIVRQLLIESLLLAALAGAVGWGLSLAAIRAISSALGGNEAAFPTGSASRWTNGCSRSRHACLPGHRVALRSRAGAADVEARNRQHARGGWPRRRREQFAAAAGRTALWCFNWR